MNVRIHADGQCSGMLWRPEPEWIEVFIREELLDGRAGLLMSGDEATDLGNADVRGGCRGVPQSEGVESLQGRHGTVGRRAIVP